MPLVAVLSSKWSGQSERMMEKINRQKYREEQRWEGEGENKPGRERSEEIDLQPSISFIWLPGAKPSQVFVKRANKYCCFAYPSLSWLLSLAAARS